MNWEIIVILLTLSGWTSFVYLVYSTKPRLKGSVIAICVAKKKFNITSYIIYPYIINHGTQTTEIVDFKLEINFGRGFIPLKRDIIQRDVLSFDFQDLEGKSIKINNFPDKILSNKSCIAKTGEAIHGFLVFEAPEEYYKKSEINFNLVCLDANWKKHSIIFDNTKINLWHFQDITGMKFYEDYTIH